MAFDLGDPIPLVFNPTDVGGNPVDVGVASLTITLPDNTTTSPAVTHVAVGDYEPTVPFIATQAGRHLVRWVATAPNAQAYTDSFDVIAADALIIGLEQARAGLRIPVGQVVDDEDLRDLIAGATATMEDICGAIIRRPFADDLDGGATSVHTIESPLISVTTVIESYGAGYTRTLTLQNLQSGTFDAFGYTVDLDTGMITRRVAGQAAAFAAGVRNIHVEGIAGRTSVSPNLIRATRRLVRWLWQTESQGQRPNGSQPEKTSTTPSGYLVPSAVLALCAGERRAPGIG